MKKIFRCQICRKEYSILSHLSIHVGKIHGDKKEYYDKYIKKEREGICPECKSPTQYTNLWQNAYLKYCSNNCKKIGVVKQIEKTTFKKYGVSNINKLKTHRDKIKKTNEIKYGNSCPMQNKEIQKNIKEKNLKNLGVELPFQSKNIQDKSSIIREKKYGAKYTYQSKELLKKINTTNNEKYGVDFPIQSEEIQKKMRKNSIIKNGVPYQISSIKTRKKIKETNMRKFGVENCMSSIIVREKFKEGMIKKYNVPYSMQNQEIFDKAFKTRILLKKYMNTNLCYQGSYELDFLEKYYNKLNIQKASFIRYKFKRNQKIYYPDFFISNLNLIVEIKNSYLAKRDYLQIKAKEKAVLSQGYQFIMIVNKDYTEFENLLSSSIYK